MYHKCQLFWYSSIIARLRGICMKHNVNSRTKLSNHKTVILLIVLFSLLIIILAWSAAKYYVQNLAMEHYQLHVNENIDQIEKRMLNYANVLRSGIALFQASTKVTRDDWHYFVDTLELKKYYPGLQGIGYSVMLLPTEVNALEKKIRAEGHPTFTLTPKGKRNQYSSIIYLEPMDKRNLKTIGYDMYSEPTRRSAMQRARDTGTASVSGRVTLKQEIDSDIQQGILMYLPLYKRGRYIDTIQQRKDALLGFVYSPFRMNDLMKHIVLKSSIIDFEIYDSEKMTRNHLLYQSFQSSNYLPKFRSRKTLIIGGHLWNISFSSTPEFDAKINDTYPQLLAAGGLIVYFFLLYIILNLAKSKRVIQEKSTALEYEKNRAQHYLDIAGTMILVLDNDNNLLLINKRGCEIMGYTADEMIGKNWIKNFLPARFRIQVEIVSYGIKEKDSFKHFENTVLTKNGTERLLSWINTPLFDDKGICIGILTSGEDVTEIRLAEKRIKESEQRLQTIIQTEPECVKVIDKNAKLLEMNTAGLAMLEANTLEEAQALSLVDYLLPKGRASFIALHKKVMQGESGTLEFEVRGLRGTRRWLETHAAPMRDEDGNVIALLGVTRDITESKNAKTLLEQSEQFYRTIFATVHEAIFILKDNIVVDCNDMALKLFESKKENLIGSSIQNANRSIMCNQYSFDKYLEISSTDSHVEVRCSVVLNGNTKETKVIELAISSFVGKHNKQILIARDITKQLENDKHAIIYSRQAQMGEMISMIAHQWRQPLAVVNSITAQVRIRELMKEEQNSFLFDKMTDIEDQILHLSQTITDFKDFHNSHKPKELIQLSQTVHNTLSFMDHIIKSNGIDINIIINKDSKLFLYSNEIRQVIITLLKNSLDAFKEKEITDCKVIISLDQNDKYAILSISDNAGGISSSVIQNIFLPYFTTKNANNGTGLGLHICKMLIENQINGLIEVSSQDQNTTFIIKIPLSTIEE